MLELKLSLFTAWIALKSTFCSCFSGSEANFSHKEAKRYNIVKIARLPAIANESSGLARGDTDNTFFTHSDSGGKNNLYKFNLNGELEEAIPVPVKNKDWEDLAQDEQGRIWIGDFGNNSNTRKDLKIYVTDPQQAGKVDTLHFAYPDQQAFPPAPKEMNFDCEAFFYYQDSLYLFSKNRGRKEVKLYTLPAQPGNWVARLADTQYLNGQITAADISPDGTSFALLAYGKVYLFMVRKGVIDFSQPKACIPFAKGGQSEAIVFINNNDLLITNEKGKTFLMQYTGH